MPLCYNTKLTKKQNTTVERERGGKLVEREAGFHTSSMNGIFKNWITFG